MGSESGVLPVVQLGFGNVGRALARRVARARVRFPWLKQVGIADHTGLWLVPGGITPEAVESAIASKEEQTPLALWCPVLPDSQVLPRKESFSPALVQRLDALGLGPVVVVDVTISQELYPLHLALRKAGHHIVLANKWPLAVPYGQYRELWDAGGGFLLHETTVGAALPVIRTLENLVASGEEIGEITASISGTMGYVTSAISEGVPFSEALGRASELGYTETDPRLDLGGVDARRKALILARKIGEQIDLEDVEVTSLVPQGLEDVEVEEFRRELPRVDEYYARKVEQAANNGQVLRYLASIAPGRKPQVGLVAVPKESVFASTRGTESLFAFNTSSYGEQPLVVRGQGAGGDLTAGGVLADVLAVRAERLGATKT
jgi:homoserine dehydrogenase